MRPLGAYSVPFRSRSGGVVAHVTLTSTRETGSDHAAALVEVEEAEAREYGETQIQLRESERYEYEVVSDDGKDLRLRCSLATRWKSLRPDSPDAGLLETRSFCGTLLMELVSGEVEASKAVVASALLDVRSLKLDYRTQYRGMLRRLADELLGLVVDARSSAKVGFLSSFEERREAGWLQIQLELLRDTLDSSEFVAAMQRILSLPHERLSLVNDSVATERVLRWSPPAVRQLLSGHPRREVPAAHGLRLRHGIQNVSERVYVDRKTRTLDTVENRFVKFALGDCRAFLIHAVAVFESAPGWDASAALAQRLGSTIGDWLSRGLFQEVGDLRFVPLGSPVLQRKVGYRQILRAWLRFRTAASISWEGGEDVFRAGQRDAASLYEYWLFFELLGWFCAKCRGGDRPAIEELVEGAEEGVPNLRLKRAVELGPFEGVVADSNRMLRARFTYNRAFRVTRKRGEQGSWTRRLHPDYTLTFWPAHLTEDEAEGRELLVHLHFDAKYRIEDLNELFGAEDGEDADEESEGRYKRQDLLKMHAYRDAIKRSQGAYVLYPGGRSQPELFKGFHEILPGLGAFSVVPGEDGHAHGMEGVERFLDDALTHLSNRTTAQERVSYHIAEAYEVREQPVAYGGLTLPEEDVYGKPFRALPPAEHYVLVAWYETEGQKTLARSSEGLFYVRLGTRAGRLHVHPNLARVRHILLRSHRGAVEPGLLLLQRPGFSVYTRSQLRREMQRRGAGLGVSGWQERSEVDDEEYIYALFQTRADATYAEVVWDGGSLMTLIEAFEADIRNRPVDNLGRTSPYPRILPLRDVLRARRGP